MTTFSFTDRESYLAWVAEWQKLYRETSAEIRVLKRQRKQYLRGYPEGADRRTSKRGTLGPNPEWNPETGWQLSKLRHRAAIMMIERNEAKAEGIRQKTLRAA